MRGNEERGLVRQWVERWKRVGPQLESIRRRELRAMTDEQAKRAALDLLTLPQAADLPPRASSGLVDLQRWFGRLRAR